MKHKITWKKDWPWISLAAIAVGFFFFHPHAPGKAPKTQSRQVKGRGHYANRGDHSQ
jgi:hypothetical protein